MKLFIKILLFVFVALVTNVKVISATITFPNTQESTIFFPFKNEAPKTLYKVIENDLANCCENEQNLVAYRSWGISVVDAAKTSTSFAEGSFSDGLFLDPQLAQVLLFQLNNKKINQLLVTCLMTGYYCPYIPCW